MFANLFFNKAIESRRNLLQVGVLWVLLNTILLYILSFHFYLPFTPENLGVVDSFYLYSFTFVQFFLLAFIPFLIVYVPSILLTTKHRSLCGCLLGSFTFTLFIIFIVVDAYVFSLYRFHLNKTVYEQMEGPGAGQVFELSAQIYLLALVVFLFLIALEISLFSLSRKIHNLLGEKKMWCLCGFISLLFVFVNVVHIVSSYKNYRQITLLDSYLPGPNPINLNKTLNSLGLDTPKLIDVSFVNKHYKYPLHPIIDKPSYKNVVFIVLDSWTYNSLNAINCPNIYQFSKSSSVFTHHYSGGNCTRNGIFSAFYGLPGVFWYDFKDQHIEPVMMREFKKNHYDVKLFPSASLQNPAFDDNIFFSYKSQCNAAKGDKAWQRDDFLTHSFIQYLNHRDVDTPFFAFLFYDSLHSMILPDNYKAKFSPTWSFPNYAVLNNNTNSTPFYNLYKNMLWYLDGLVSNVLENIKKKGLLDNTVIIITGDHGQEFNENHKNFWGHNGNFSSYQLQVPFIYYEPNKTPITIGRWTSHRDIVPTIMESVFGVENPSSDYCLGNNIFKESDCDFQQVDGYNGLAIIDADGTINNVNFNESWCINDSKLNLLINKPFPFDKYNKFIKSTRSFYN